MFYASYGSFMHRLIEQYYKGNLSKEDMLIKFLFGFQNEVKGERPSGNIVQSYIEKGTKYIQNIQRLPYNVVAVEKKVEFDIDGIPFLGFIDLICEKDGDYYIVDHKSRDLKPRSSRKTPTKKDQELDEMLRQLYVYSSAVKQEYGKYPKRLCFNCFKSGTFIEEPFDLDAYNETVKWVKESVDEVMNCDDFYPSVDFFGCQFICGLDDECEYKEMR